MNQTLLKVRDVYSSIQDSIYLVEVDKENYILEYIEVPIIKNKINIALKLSAEEKEIDFHVGCIKCIKVLLSERVGWANISFFDKIYNEDY